MFTLCNLGVDRTVPGQECSNDARPRQDISVAALKRVVELAMMVWVGLGNVDLIAMARDDYGAE